MPLNKMLQNYPIEKWVIERPFECTPDSGIKLEITMKGERKKIDYDHLLFTKHDSPNGYCVFQLVVTKDFTVTTFVFLRANPGPFPIANLRFPEQFAFIQKSPEVL